MSVWGVALAAVTGSLALYLQGCDADSARDLMSSCEELAITNGKISASGRVVCNAGFAYSGPAIGCKNNLIRMCPRSKRDGGVVQDGSDDGAFGEKTASDCADLAGHTLKKNENDPVKIQHLAANDDHGGILSVNSEKDALRAKGQIIQEQSEAKIKQTVSCSASAATKAPAAVKLFDSPGGDTLQGNHLGSYAAAVALMGFITMVVVHRRRTGTSHREIDVESELETVLDGVE